MEKVRKKTRGAEGFPDDILGNILLAYEHALFPCQVFASSPPENPQAGIMN